MRGPEGGETTVRERPQPVTRTLGWASGHTVAEVDEFGDRLHYKRAGALVLVATGIAFVVALSFLFFGVDPVSGPVLRGVQLAAFVVVAALVASAICAMDRWIVATVYDRDSIVFRLLLLGVRVLVSVPMALLAAFTLTPLLAAGPVNQELAAQHDAEAARLVADPVLVAAEGQARERLAGLDQAVAQAQRTYDAALFALSKEESGLGPSARPGCGAACKANQTSVGQARSALLAAQQDERKQTPVRQAEVVAAQQATADDLTRRREVIDDNDDVFARHNALRAVSERDPSIRYLALIIELLLITIDLLPALLKALSPRTRLEAAQVAERMQFREQQAAETEAARQARVDGALLADRRAAHALQSELQDLEHQTSREIARLQQEHRRQLAQSQLALEAQVEAAKREALLQVEAERQRALLEVEAARTAQTRAAGLAAAAAAADAARPVRWVDPPDTSDTPTPWWRQLRLSTLAVALVALLGTGVVVASTQQDEPRTDTSSAPLVAATQEPVQDVPTDEPTATPTASASPAPTTEPPPDEPGAPAPVFLSIEGSCNGESPQLIGFSANFTPDGPYRVESQTADGTPLDEPDVTGTVRSDGTIRWVWQCNAHPAGTYRTRVIDETSQRDTGWIDFNA